MGARSDAGIEAGARGRGRDGAGLLPGRRLLPGRARRPVGDVLLAVPELRHRRERLCWGNPDKFQSDLFVSDFIHVTDQYVRSTANGRYHVGSSVNIAQPQPHIMQVSDVEAVVIAAIKTLFPSGGGGGYTNVYHLFLPQGQDTCLDPSDCYPPDDVATWTICAYHPSVDTTDATGNPIHVLYTVEPYQDLPGCQVNNPPYPNSQLVDSTNNTLSHEIFELITDPDGDAWWESPHAALSGQEIADICFAEPYKFSLNGTPYDVQLVYDNSSHSRGSAPGSGAPPRLINVSTRSLVEVGDNVMIAGVVVSGSGPRRVLIRAQGPSLANFGVAGVLPNPFLQVFSGSTLIAQNDDWQVQDMLCQQSGFTCGSSADILATGLAPGSPLEPAILITLPPGPYTAVVSGVGGSTGVAIAEAFENSPRSGIPGARIPLRTPGRRGAPLPPGRRGRAPPGWVERRAGAGGAPRHPRARVSWAIGTLRSGPARGVVGVPEGDADHARTPRPPYNGPIVSPGRSQSVTGSIAASTRIGGHLWQSRPIRNPRARSATPGAGSSPARDPPRCGRAPSA